MTCEHLESLILFVLCRGVTRDRRGPISDGQLPKTAVAQKNCLAGVKCLDPVRMGVPQPRLTPDALA